MRVFVDDSGKGLRLVFLVIALFVMVPVIELINYAISAITRPDATSSLVEYLITAWRLLSGLALWFTLCSSWRFARFRLSNRIAALVCVGAMAVGGFVYLLGTQIIWLNCEYIRIRSDEFYLLDGCMPEFIGDIFLFVLPHSVSIALGSVIFLVQKLRKPRESGI